MPCRRLAELPRTVILGSARGAHRSGAVRAHEDRFTAAIYERLATQVRDRLDALLRPAATATSDDDEGEPSTSGARALLNFVRGDPGLASVDSVMRELERRQISIITLIKGFALCCRYFTFVI